MQGYGGEQPIMQMHEMLIWIILETPEKFVEQLSVLSWSCRQCDMQVRSSYMTALLKELNHFLYKFTFSCVRCFFLDKFPLTIFIARVHGVL